jgi:hypothetical protein
MPSQQTPVSAATTNGPLADGQGPFGRHAGQPPAISLRLAAFAHDAFAAAGLASYV